MLKSLLVDYNPVARVSQYLFHSSPLLQGVADYLRQLLFNKDDETLEKLLFLAGVAALTYSTGKVLREAWGSWGWVLPHFVNQGRLNGPALKKKYGNCWVVITGFTQGIGRGFAEIFAEFGFNLLLVSRDEERCRLKANDLRQRYKDIEIRHASCNMSDKQEISRLESIFAEWRDLDIGIVVNNAGSVAGGPYFGIAPE
jgi:17beta-estradiol 17-dehydrogenase / very-long-chain 3-oxoacyl-CoA reductase